MLLSSRDLAGTPGERLKASHRPVIPEDGVQHSVQSAIQSRSSQGKNEALGLGEAANLLKLSGGEESGKGPPSRLRDH